MSLLDTLARIVSPRPAAGPPPVVPDPGPVVVDRRARDRTETAPRGRGGNPGTRWSRERPLSEKAPELQGRRWPETAREMLRTDPKLAGIVRMLTHTLLSARYEVDPGDDTAEAARNAEYVRQALGLEGRSCRLASGAFEGELAKMLLFAPIGYRVLEEVYYVGADGLVWLEEWSDTEPDSIREWRRDPSGRLTEIIQERITGALPADAIEIDATKAIVLTLGRTGDDYEGTGILRPCWGWWRLKRHTMDQLGVGIERWATPTPLVSGDRSKMGEAGYSEDESTDLIGRAAAWAEGYVSGAREFIVAPAGVEVSVYGDGAFKASELLSVINHANQEMATSALAHFLELGLGDVGSRSVGQIHWNAWRGAVSNILDYLCSVLCGRSRPGGGTFDRLLGFNFYQRGYQIPVSKLPRLRHVGVDVDGLSDALGTLPALVQSSLLTPTDDLESRIRRLAGVGDGGDETKRGSVERLGAALGTPVDPSGGEGRPSGAPLESR
jgi:hypothetical protein